MMSFRRVPMSSRKMSHSMLAVLGMLLSACTQAAASLPDAFGKWTGGPAVTITDKQLDEIAPENAALIREYGFVSGTRREYSNGANKARITQWEMKDASGSLGLFTYFNVPGMRAEKFGDSVATFKEGLTYVWSGAYLVEARGAEIPRGDLEELSKQLPATDEQRAILPSLPSFFPSENLVPMTRKYVLGPVGLSRVLTRIPASKLGLEPGIEAAVANYQMGSNTATMVLLLYPTPQLAAKKFTEFLELPELTDAGGPLHTLTQRKGSLVGIVLDAPSVSEATRLLDHVSYETNLMWNEYVPPQGQNVGNLILAVFALAGAVIVFALIAGVAFGGFRIFAKKYIPFPIFDRPVDTELVKLELNRADEK
jgi:hypothetical protein